MRKCKNCKKCNKVIPSCIVVDKKVISLTSRTYCVECSPIGSKNGYEIRKENTKKSLPYKNSKVCPICERVFNYTKNNVCSSCRNAIQRYSNRKQAYEYLGNKCEICGELNEITFVCHHKNSLEKDFNLSGAWQKNWEQIKIELDKCIILCSNCHLKVHAMQTQKNMEQIKVYYNNRTN